MKRYKDLTEEEKKVLNSQGYAFNRIVGTGALIVVVIIIVINLICRFVGIKQASDYVYTEGTVISTSEDKIPNPGVRRKRGRGNRYLYSVTIAYTPPKEGYEMVYHGMAESYRYLREGQTLRVYYKEDSPYTSYPAKLDWLTGQYLPADQSYNLPLVIAGVILVIGVALTADNRKSLKKLEKKKAEEQPD
ncbi:MAG: DUF3592 domain-containing protein [Clostridiales bacterium]|nr:DUF3592 domain-containing protein [Clostridiales bacterium]